MKTKIILLGLFIFYNLIFGQNYSGDYNIFYRTFKAQYYENTDSTRYTESLITVSTNNEWTYHSDTFSKWTIPTGLSGWQKIEEKWAGGHWTPESGFLTIHLSCDSIKVTCNELKFSNEIVYKRYPPDSQERYNDYWIELKQGKFAIHRYCYVCRDLHKLYTYEIDLNKKRT